MSDYRDNIGKKKRQTGATLAALASSQQSSGGDTDSQQSSGGDTDISLTPKELGLKDSGSGGDSSGDSGGGGSGGGGQQGGGGGQGVPGIPEGSIPDMGPDQPPQRLGGVPLSSDTGGQSDPAKGLTKAGFGIPNLGSLTPNLSAPTEEEVKKSQSGSAERAKDSSSGSGGDSGGDSGGGGGGGGGGFIDSAVSTITGAADAAAGSVDESVARQFDKKKGGGTADETAEAATGAADTAAGSTDEAVSRQFDDKKGGGAVDEAVDAVTGAADTAAGSVDESVERQFDKKKGGGFVDETVEAATGVADFAAGSVDEAFGRQFDNKKGGGVADVFGNTVGKVTSGTGSGSGGSSEDVQEKVTEIFKKKGIIPPQGKTKFKGGAPAGQVFNGIKVLNVGVPSRRKISDSSNIPVRFPIKLKNVSKKTKAAGARLEIGSTYDARSSYAMDPGETKTHTFPTLPQNMPSGQNDVSLILLVNGSEKESYSLGTITVGGPKDRVPNTESKPVKWTKPKVVATVTGAKIFKQKSVNTKDNRVRYFAIGKTDKGTLVAFSSDGEAVPVNSVEKFSQLPHYSSLSNAKDAVPTRKRSSATGRRKKGVKWSKPQSVDRVGNVIIMKQTGTTSSGATKERFFAVTKTSKGNIVILKSANSFVRMSSIDSISEAPSFSSLSKAKSVAQNYMNTITGGSGAGGGGATRERDSGGSGGGGGTGGGGATRERSSGVSGGGTRAGGGGTSGGGTRAGGRDITRERSFGGSGGGTRAGGGGTTNRRSFGGSGGGTRAGGGARRVVSTGPVGSDSGIGMMTIALGIGALAVGGGLLAATSGDEDSSVKVVRASPAQSGRQNRGGNRQRR